MKNERLRDQSAVKLEAGSTTDRRVVFVSESYGSHIWSLTCSWLDMCICLVPPLST